MEYRSQTVRMGPTYSGSQPHGTIKIERQMSYPGIPRTCDPLGFQMPGIFGIRKYLMIPGCGQLFPSNRSCLMILLSMSAQLPAYAL